MSTLALKLDEALNRLDAEKRAELENVVTMTILRLVGNGVKESMTEEERDRRFRACAGSIPDLPEDFEESPWETDRDPLP